MMHFAMNCNMLSEAMCSCARIINRMDAVVIQIVSILVCPEIIRLRTLPVA